MYAVILANDQTGWKITFKATLLVTIHLLYSTANNVLCKIIN